MNHTVYINALASFLPNQPVNNDEMERLLGMVQKLPSRTRRIILRNNRIRQRYYAIDRQTGETTHSNAQMTAEAIRQLAPEIELTPDQIECLCCGTSTPDQLMPGHASMVHGELGGAPCEILSASGICGAGMGAMKYAWLSVANGQTRNAVATGSELASSYMRARLCGGIDPSKTEQLHQHPALSFEADFLRWMLSDGAGAALLSSQPNPSRPSLRIEWIDQLSYAHEFEPCMYAGADKLEDGSLRGWREHPNLAKLGTSDTLLVKQDVKLLNAQIITVAVEKALLQLAAKHRLRATDVDWFLPHYSSEFFRPHLKERMDKVGFSIDEERWFTNLHQKGNTGAASIYIILDEIFHSGRIKKGEKLLCFIPESGRFSMCYMLLTFC
ncbi:hypothetical protein C2E25_06125 [Geothermobacter hydrogeniphilus]|uniref:Beta-ketoacyl-[acyl-carrier-protein] synthase III C-terminal domain-containing protein n=1 Tax=Geothermobacter hydrogeniphilus TaxID=1969733 RepID=A0A2K2HBC4_9BACT|nr:beta-ketoacyl-ACP synthase III [Geothermobacter hydrogeniphilus]PNU20618.1 hypothetical protein C2E25_06125 [Geothermobacter hydrogeniphilus]